MNLQEKIANLAYENGQKFDFFNQCVFENEVEKLLPRLRYVEKDGLPPEDVGHCIVIFKRSDGSLFTNNYHSKDLLFFFEHGLDEGKLFAWIPENEFLEAFVGGEE